MKSGGVFKFVGSTTTPHFPPSPEVKRKDRPRNDLDLEHIDFSMDISHGKFQWPILMAMAYIV